MAFCDRRAWTGLLAAGVVLGVGLSASAQTTVPKPLPDPDGSSADQSKPAQVYIMMGQSNMVGFGDVGGTSEGTLRHAVDNGKYPHLVDDSGNWNTRNDVYYVHNQGSGGTGDNGSIVDDTYLTPEGLGHIGPEIGFGNVVGHATDAPVMLVKSAIGNRALGWDLAPPGTPQRDYDGYTYPAYGGSPERWETGTDPEPIGWQAGLQYDGDVHRAHRVINNIGDYYPDYQGQGYEIAGFVWWQGARDKNLAGHAEFYEENLVRLVKELRKEFSAPEAKFVLATLGETSKDELDVAEGEELSNAAKILEGMLAVDGDSGKYPEFDGNVGTVYSNPISYGGSSNGHYGGDGRTYYEIGDALGQEILAIPEPGTLALLGLGGAALAARPRRRGQAIARKS
jgi:hypothetical protein